jgi:hypothetical protein
VSKTREIWESSTIRNEYLCLSLKIGM